MEYWNDERKRVARGKAYLRREGQADALPCSRGGLPKCENAWRCRRCGRPGIISREICDVSDRRHAAKWRSGRRSERSEVGGIEEKTMATKSTKKHENKSS